MADPISVRQLINRVVEGTIRIPAFQRGFVWTPDNVAFLMDSIYRGFPVGSLLFWRTNEELQRDRHLGPFELPAPQKDYPIDYVLDGQQRITSIFGVFQNQLEPSEEGEWFDVYFDFESPEGAFEEQFLPLAPDQVVEGRHFPLRVLMDNTRLMDALPPLSQPQRDVVAQLMQRFQDANLPVESIEYEDREQVAMIFERVNRAGEPLDTFQLLSAWTWSTEFELAERFDELSAELEPYGFDSIKNDPNLLMKCCSAVLGGAASVREIVSLNGPEVRRKFGEIENGVRGAIDFLRAELNVYSMRVMPYPAMIVPLVAFFSTDSDAGFHPNAIQRAELKRWFWKCCFGRRYSGGVGRAHASDIEGMRTLRHNENHIISGITANIDPGFFLNNRFSLGSVNSKTLILLLAQLVPKSFLSGAVVGLEDVLLACNRKEFHHIFPKKYLSDNGVDNFKQNVLANICFLSTSDNRRIRDKSPRVYKNDIPNNDRQEILESHAINIDGLDRNYDDFLNGRATLLSDRAIDLMA